MKKKYILITLKSIIVLMSLYLSTQVVTGQTSVLYDFNTPGQLSSNFNQTGSSINITQSTNTGISGTGAVNVTIANTFDIFTTKDAFSLGIVGSEYELTSYIKSVWNSGYSGLGFTTSSPAVSGSGSKPDICMGIMVHGGGYIFYNNSAGYMGNWNSAAPEGVTAVKISSISDLLNNGSPDDWYKIVFKITRLTATTYKLRVEVWSITAAGALISPSEADAIFEVNNISNTDITNAPVLYSYFNFEGSRVSDFDNFGIVLTGGSTVVEDGEPVVLTTNSLQSGNTITLDGNVTDDNGQLVTARGIVYNTSANPTISNSVVTSGSGTGNFSATTPSLANGTYYLRTYATNSIGTSYGAEVSYTVANQPMTLIFNTNLDPGNRTVTLPLNGTVNVTVDWGDGNTEPFTTSGNKDHTYATEGTYTVTITGSLTWFGSSNYPNANKLVSVTNFGDLGLTNLSHAFDNATNLIEAPTVLPATVTNLAFTFSNCTNFNFDISTWNVSNVTIMAYLFCNASSFNQNIGGWNVSNVTTMMSTFYGASAFNQNIGSWNVSNVTDMWAMFCYASAFNQNIGSWNVANLLSTRSMFYGATAFNQDISSWNVGNVTDMGMMFLDATSFNQNISGWNVSSATNMGYMFYNASSFNQNISGWNVSNATNMNSMFYGAINFEQNIGSWNVINVTNMTNMFTGVTLSITNYDALLIGWSGKILNTDVTFSGGNSKYSCVAGANARAILTDAPYSWIITDGGVGDETAPVITSTHSDQTLNANASCQASLPSYTSSLTATDNCTASGSLVITQSPAAGTEISGAINTVTLRATDNYGNYSEVTFNVAVLDNIYPVITSTHIDQTLDANTSCEASLPSYTASVAATDNCTASGSIVVTQSPIAGTTISGETNTITLRATDATGNFVETTFNVAVVDNTNPVITSTHNNQTINVNASCQASLPSYTASVTATDNCTASGSIVITQSPAAGTTISGATNTITLRATDATGNFVETSFNVAVVDDTNPTVITQNITISLDETGNAVITADQINNGSSDNCSIASMSVSPGTFTCTNTGENTVTLTVFDASGNSSSATAIVTVQDLELPQLVLPANITTLVDVGLLTAVVNYDEPYGFDNCSVASIYQTSGLPSGATFPLGVTVNTFEAIDASGNIISESFEVNVVLEESMEITLSSPQTSSCEGDLINIDYTVLSGIPVQYRIIFSQEAKNAGFVDIPYTAITETISFASPALVADGNYQGQIQFRNSTGAESELYSFNFTMNLSSEYVVAKFNDVVLCDNKENRFVSYQWYKDGVIIDGATNQFYNDPNGLSGVYSVAAVTTDGNTIHTCGKYFNLVSAKNVELSVFPNPANINDNFVVKVTNLNAEDLTGAVMLIYNSKGSMVYSTKKVDFENYVNLPLGGEYFGVIKTLKGNSFTYKVIVVK